MKLLLALATSAFALVASASSSADRVNKPVYCLERSQVVSVLASVGERVIWSASVDDPPSEMSLWFSSEHQTWTITQSAGNRSCIIDWGQGSRFSLDPFILEPKNTPN